MSFPADLKYATTHEWIRVEGNIATVGITAFAQNQLGDVVFVDMPDVDSAVTKGDSVAEVESTKTVSDVYAPVSGIVYATNEGLEGNEDQVNSDPYGDGWLFKIDLSDISELDRLMDAAAYAATVEAAH
ncbi:MAG: glycine cleavage system protein GcvH [Oligoflexia bacterium]|nr:glycine cleavage system protein GcvH [Oligoflexia bacterium]